MSDTTLRIVGSLTDNFMMLSNDMGRNPEVTPRAGRLFMYLASHQTGWKLSITAAVKATGMSRGTVFAALKDLRQLGYVKRYQLVDEEDRFAGTEYQIFALALPEDERDDVESGTDSRMRKSSTRDDVQKQDKSAGDSRVTDFGIRKNRIRKNDTLKKTNLKEDQPEEDQEEDPPVVPPRGDAPAPAKTEPENPSKEIEPAGKQKPAKRNDRGSRLEDGWMPSQKVIDQMRQECPHVNLEYEHRKFTDYWLSVPASRGRKSNWDATWRNWIRRASESRTGGNTPPQETFDYYADMLIQEHRAQQAANSGQIMGQTQWELPQ